MYKRQILRDVKALAGIRRAELNFSTSTLSIEINGDGAVSYTHLDVYKRQEVKLYLVEGLPTILPILSDVSIRKAENFMKKHGVELITGAFITSVSPDSITIKTGDEIASIPTRTLIWTGGIQGNQFAVEQGAKPGKKGRILVNDFLEVEDKEGVFAIGDNAYHEDEKGNICLLYTSFSLKNIFQKQVICKVHPPILCHHLNDL